MWCGGGSMYRSSRTSGASPSQSHFQPGNFLVMGAVGGGGGGGGGEKSTGELMTPKNGA